MVLQIERRNSSPTESSYTSQILIGSLVHEHDSHHLFGDPAASPQPHLWCSNCFADDPVTAGTGAVKIPHWLRGRYFTRPPTCKTCNKTTYFFSAERTFRPGDCYLFESLTHPPLQREVEEKLAEHGGIFATTCTRQIGPAATAEFRDELLAVAFSPERVGAIDAAHGRAAVRELLTV